MDLPSSVPAERCSHERTAVMRIMGCTNTQCRRRFFVASTHLRDCFRGNIDKIIEERNNFFDSLFISVKKCGRNV